MHKLLVANRGEIAVRIIHAARELGLRTVAVYSEADRDAPHTHLADEAYLLGPSEPAQSYLDSARLLDVVRTSGADAVHPGYGFLAENAAFAEDCRRAGVLYVGPSAEAIRQMGSKILSKQIAERAGVPIVPSYHAPDTATLAQQGPDVAGRLGYPVLVKASAGGGGKGMRIVERPIPTYYGDEICYVNGIAYAFNCVRSALAYRLHLAGLLDVKKYQIQGGRYIYKTADSYSSHAQMLAWVKKERPLDVLEIGTATGYLTAELTKLGCRVTGIEQDPQMAAIASEYCEKILVDDIETMHLESLGEYDAIVLGDVLEHLRSPCDVLQKLARRLKPGGKVLMSLPNVASVWLRLNRLFGRFNYNRVEIVDESRLRSFTLQTSKKLAADSDVPPARVYDPPHRVGVGAGELLDAPEPAADQCGRVRGADASEGHKTRRLMRRAGVVRAQVGAVGEFRYGAPRDSEHVLPPRRP